MNHTLKLLLAGVLLLRIGFSQAGELGSGTGLPSFRSDFSLSNRSVLDGLSSGDSFGERPIRAQLTAIRQTIISTEISGRINRLTLTEGSAFGKDEVLARFDCSVYRAQLNKVQAELDSATARHKTIQRLTELKSKGKLELELAEIEVLKAQADLEMSKIQVDRCVIKAPFAGLVSEKLVNQEQYVQAGTPLFKLIDDSSLQVEFIAPSRYLQWLKRGASFQLAIDETVSSYTAVIQRFGADVDAVSQSIKVFAELDNQHRELMVGMSGRVTLVQPKEYERQVEK
jgi:RND family efflux transporter MFP subunit